MAHIHIRTSLATNSEKKRKKKHNCKLKLNTCGYWPMVSDFLAVLLFFKETATNNLEMKWFFFLWISFSFSSYTFPFFLARIEEIRFSDCIGFHFGWISPLEPGIGVSNGSLWVDCGIGTRCYHRRFLSRMRLIIIVILRMINGDIAGCSRNLTKRFDWLFAPRAQTARQLGLHANVTFLKTKEC